MNGKTTLFLSKIIFGLLFITLIGLFSVSCGKKAKTNFAYQPTGIPLSFKCSRQADGLWQISGGAITPVGIFAIEQTFDMRDEFTYLVIRDRAKGSDQVFKLGTKGYVELHTIGEHKIRIEREENKIILDVDTVSGSFDFNIYADGEIVTRVEFGNGDPDFLILNSKRLVIEYQGATGIFWNDDSLPLDSLQSVELVRVFGSGGIIFHWKDSVKEGTTPFILNLSSLKDSEKKFSDLQKALADSAPHITFKQTYSNLLLYILCGFIAGCFLTAIPAFKFGKKHFSESDKLRAEREKDLSFWRKFVSNSTLEENKHNRYGCLGSGLSFFSIIGVIIGLMLVAIWVVREFA
jgi:hypothetical protein